MITSVYASVSAIARGVKREKEAKLEHKSLHDLENECENLKQEINGLKNRLSEYDHKKGEAA